MRTIQAMYSGTPEGLAEWLGSYTHAGARHIVLRVMHEDQLRGLEQAAAARELAVELA